MLSERFWPSRLQFQTAFKPGDLHLGSRLSVFTFFFIRHLYEHTQWNHLMKEVQNYLKVVLNPTRLSIWSFSDLDLWGTAVAGPSVYESFQSFKCQLRADFKVMWASSVFRDDVGLLKKKSFQSTVNQSVCVCVFFFSSTLFPTKEPLSHFCILFHESRSCVASCSELY